jgi:hypothetical protein
MAVMRGRDFAVVASSIRFMRSVVQTDLDRSYSDHGALVLDRLTEQLADDFAARYPGFNEAAFLNDTQFRQGFDRLDDDVSVGPCIGSHLVYTVGYNRRGGPPEHEPCSFKRFEEAKSAMAEELDHHAGLHAQPESESRLENIIKAIQAHLYNARGPEWYHSDGSCEFWIVQSEA